MRQVTGKTNPAIRDNKVSIQLLLDGHSFSVRGLDSLLEGDAEVEVCVYSPKTALVPTKFLEGSNPALLLAANGMPPFVDEEVVISPVSHEPGGCNKAASRENTVSVVENEVCAVMALNRAALDQVREKTQDRPLKFSSPLLHRPASTERTIWIDREGDLIYIKVYRRSLLMAEVLPAQNDADLNLIFDRMNAEFPAGEHELQLAGSDTKRLRKLFGKRFIKTLCE